MATQNPVELEGTFPLPEAQLDRFLVRLKLGYPDEDDEDEILRAIRDRQSPLESLRAGHRTGASWCVSRLRSAISTSTRSCAATPSRSSRRPATDPAFELGASPRAQPGALPHGAGAGRHLGRDYVLPDDVKAMAPHVLPHRLILSTQARLRGRDADELLAEVLQRVPVPDRRPEMPFRDRGCSSAGCSSSPGLPRPQPATRGTGFVVIIVGGVGRYWSRHLFDGCSFGEAWRTPRLHRRKRGPRTLTSKTGSGCRCRGTNGGLACLTSGGGGGEPRCGGRAGPEAGS